MNREWVINIGWNANAYDGRDEGDIGPLVRTRDDHSAQRQNEQSSCNHQSHDLENEDDGSPMRFDVCVQVSLPAIWNVFIKGRVGDLLISQVLGPEILRE
jgi:hypothetical protein